MTGIIVAYDRSVFTGRENFVIKELAGLNVMVKIGLEAMNETVDGQTIAEKVYRHCQNLKIPVMWDQKIFDTERTVEKTVENILKRRSVKMFTISAAVSTGALKCAVELCRGTDVLPLAVTALTDMDEKDCVSVYDRQSRSAALKLAMYAKTCGIRGLVCSAHELICLKESGLHDMTFVVPGIRPAGCDHDDQKRVMTPREAVLRGANYLVIGRPIMNARDPVVAVRKIRASLH